MLNIIFVSFFKELLGCWGGNECESRVVDRLVSRSRGLSLRVSRDLVESPTMLNNKEEGLVKEHFSTRSRVPF